MKHTIQVSVRFCETDMLGHVNNVSYFIYLEQARVEFIKAYSQEEGLSAYHFILASVKCDFVAQAYFDQTLEISTCVTKIGNSSLQLAHEITNAQDGTLIAKAEAVMIYFNFEQQKSEPIPEHIRTLLLPYTKNGVNA